MFRRRRFEQIPELNTSSTADISFMLLIFFLVTSSMDTDKGLLRQLPPPPQEQQPPQDVRKDHVLQITLDARERYGKGYGELFQEQRDEVNQYYPQRISESKPSEEGGAE